jgi:peroxiredoxin
MTRLALVTRLALILLCAAGVALAAAQATAQVSKPKAAPTADSASQIASLDGVAWEGAGVRLDQLKGKTVVVVTYVTWCPRCNEWAPGLLKSVNTAITDKPVIVLAVSTDTPPAKAKEYMDRAGLAGPNVLNGYDPKLAKSFGFSNEFFNYVVIDPKGEMIDSGSFGSRYHKDGKLVSAVVGTLDHAKDLGKLRFVDAGMSPELKEMMWSMELGYIAEVQRSLKKAEKTLKPDDRALLKTKMESFLDEELKTAQELAAGDPGQRIDALDKASFLSANFKAASQGKEAKKILADLTKDKTLKKELSAKKMYDASMQTPDPDRRVALLEKAAKQFPGTHYGELADKAAAAAKQ